MFGPPGMVPLGIPMGVTPQGDLTPFTQFSAQGDIAPFHTNSMGDITMFPNIAPNGDPIVFPTNSMGDVVMTTAELTSPLILNAAIASVATGSTVSLQGISPDIVNDVEFGADWTTGNEEENADAQTHARETMTEIPTFSSLSVQEISVQGGTPAPHYPAWLIREREQSKKSKAVPGAHYPDWLNRELEAKKSKPR